MNFNSSTQLKFDGVYQNITLEECDDAWANALLGLCLAKFDDVCSKKLRAERGRGTSQRAIERLKLIGHALPGHYVKSDCDAVYALAKKLEKEDGIPRHVDHVIPLLARDAEGVHIMCGLHVACNLQIVSAQVNINKGCFLHAREPRKKRYTSEYARAGKAARNVISRGYVMPPWADFEAIRAVYAEARRLTRETGIPHEVDHIVSLFEKDENGEHIACGLHTPENLRIVTRAENRAKGCYSGRV